MAFVLIARMRTREGEEERAATLVSQLVAATRQEPGNILYIAHRDPEDPRAFMLYEQYDDEAAFAAHHASRHFKELGTGQLFGLLEERERTVYETLD
jgi:quinol monooxygenase YgiN